MARGSVWVLPGMLPATMTVAPNSPRAREKARTLPARMPRHASGRVTRKKARAGPQPRVRAIPTRRGSTSSKAVRAERTRSGNDITMAATKTAFQVQTISMPRSPSRVPSSDRRPLAPRHVEGGPHSLRERGVGSVDDSRICVAGLDGSQGCTHVEGGNHLRLDVVPEADRLEVPLRIDARRHGLRACERQILHHEEVPRPADVERRPHGDDRREQVREHVEAVRATDEPLPLEALHLREIGREEDVGGRSRPDLAGEVIRGAKVEGEMVSRGGLVALADLSQRVRQARRREDHDLLRHRSPRQEKRETEGDGTNPRIHATHPLPLLARATIRPHNYRTVHPEATRDGQAHIQRCAEPRRPRSSLPSLCQPWGGKAPCPARAARCPSAIPCATMRHPMATFTRFELSDARAVGRSFGIEVSAVAPVPAGSVNSNYRLETVAGESFLARIYEEQAPQDAEAVAQLIERLAAAGIPAPSPVPRVDGRGFTARHPST